MNYIELNGVKSTTIKGLLIQSLPPISKPLIRTEIEEIDGRDGDLVTKLGYAAYDKAFSIGLYGNYDIDDVIQFFDSSGTVIFSNEPDKYYRYQILEQIDFERLIRFRTATVTMHVQPFKYSAVEKAIAYHAEKITVQDFTQTKNGLTLETVHDDILISGTSTTATEFYVPIESMTLSAGTYTLKATASGTNVAKCSVRLIGSVPSNADSFGGNYIQLSTTTKTLNGTLTASKTFNYLWFYVTAGTDFNVIAMADIANSGQKSVSAVNHGNTISKPRITLYGDGTINLSLNGIQIFVINLGNIGYLTIDAAQMNAYQGERLMNRYVTGDYSNLAFKVGENVLSWSGNVTQIDIENYSRWL